MLHLAIDVHQTVVAQIENPFNWTSPSWGPFGGVLKGKVGQFLGLAWLVSIIYCAFHFMHGVALMSAGNSDVVGGAGGVQAGRHKVLWAGASATVLASIGLIFGVFLK
jgi:hypothetical protein